MSITQTPMIKVFPEVTRQPESPTGKGETVNTINSCAKRGGEHQCLHPIDFMKKDMMIRSAIKWMVLQKKRAIAIERLFPHTAQLWIVIMTKRYNSESVKTMRWAYGIHLTFRKHDTKVDEPLLQSQNNRFALNVSSMTHSLRSYRRVSILRV